MSKFKTGDRVCDIENPGQPGYMATVLSDENRYGTVQVRFDSGFGSESEGTVWGAAFLAPLEETTPAPTYTLVETLEVTAERLAEMLTEGEWTLTNTDTGQTFQVQTR